MDAHVELRAVTDELRSLTRRLDHRGEQLATLAAKLRKTSTRPTFVAPAGDRSRAFVASQARRLDMLARRYEDLQGAVGGVAGALRPRPPAMGNVIHTPLPTYKDKESGAAGLIDWDAAQSKVDDTVRRCTPVDPSSWQNVGPDDDPELPTTALRPRPTVPIPPRNPFLNDHGPAWNKPNRPIPVGTQGFTKPTPINSHGPAHHKPPRPLAPLTQTWRLDVTEIRQMARQLRSLAGEIEGLGTACRRDLNDPQGRMTQKLRGGVERAGTATDHVCRDVADRLRRHAAIVEKKISTPGLFGPGPEYGLSAFGIDPKHIPLDISTEDAFTALVAAGDQWHDRVLELTAIMEWLCRRLPVIFGTPAQAFLDLVGIDETSPPPHRPPASLPPARYPVPRDLEDPTATIVDPSTTISMTKSEYYQRYGVPFGAPLPAPLIPLPVGAATNATGTGGVTSSEPADTTSVAGVAAAMAVGAAGGAAVVGAATTSTSRRTSPDDRTATEDDEVLYTRSRRSDVGDADEDHVTYTQEAATPAAATGAASAGTEPSDGTAVPPSDSGVEQSVTTPPPADPQLAHDAAIAVRRGGVRVTPAAGAALGSVIVGGATAGLAINKRNAAKKITDWARYKASGRHLPKPKAGA